MDESASDAVGPAVDEVGKRSIEGEFDRIFDDDSGLRRRWHLDQLADIDLTIPIGHDSRRVTDSHNAYYLKRRLGLMEGRQMAGD